jgi:hypothetical protein
MFKKVILWAQGRHTLFAIYFAIFGSVLQCFHKLDGNYIALIAAVQGFVFAHSAKEDYFEAKKVAPKPAKDEDEDPQEPSK